MKHPKGTSSPVGSGAYFAIRVAVASAIMIGFYIGRGFGSQAQTFGMAFGAALASQAAAFGVKLSLGDEARTTRSLLLLAASAVAAVACAGAALLM
jgi:hypothetical protein